MEVREATRSDGTDLQPMMAGTSQRAGRLVLSIVNAPVFVDLIDL